jgi:hypothetical protein
MKEKISSKKFLLMGVLLLAAAFSRFIPHPPNFAPIAAMALFSGAYFSDKKIAFLLPIFAMFLSDLFIGLHEGMWFVYIGFALIVGIGFLLQNRIKARNVLLASLSASVAFFVITNFGVWVMGLYYPTNLAGLAQSYIAAIPFFHNAILGDLVYSGLLFGVYELAKRKVPELQLVEAK